MANENNNIQATTDDSQIVLYQPDESVRIEVKLDATHETVWLTQQQIADLFGTKRPAITKHLGNIFRCMAENLIDDLKKDFHKWVCTLHAPQDYNQKKLYIDDYARFLSFNYTTFLESHYGIPSSQVNHIHGVKTQQWGSLVVGHAEDNDKIFDQWWKSRGYDRPHYNKKGKKYFKRDNIYRMYQGDTQYLPEYESITESVESYYYDSQKPVEKIISSNVSYFASLHDVKTIYVWGFSFSKVDQPYIRKIISSNDNPQAIQWYVSIFSEEDKTKALDTLLPLSIPVDNIHFKPMSDFLINPKLNIKN